MTDSLTPNEPTYCQATVYRRDQYRVNRGHGFKMYYAAGDCGRKIKSGKYCWQHKALEAKL